MCRWVSLSKQLPSQLLKINVVIMIMAMMQIGLGLHMHSQETTVSGNVYNKNLYLQELNNIHNRFKSDLEEIKLKFTKMN